MQDPKLDYGCIVIGLLLRAANGKTKSYNHDYHKERYPNME